MACTRCGQAAAAGAALCPVCQTAVTLPVPSHEGRRLVLVVAALVLVAAIAGTTVAVLLAGGQHPVAGSPARPAAGQPRAGASTGPAATAPGAGPAAGGKPDATSSAGPPAGRAPGTGTSTSTSTSTSGAARPAVAVGSGAAARPRAAAVSRFLARYFAAINRHDYRAYLHLFSREIRGSLSAADFQAGYGSSRDSAETLTGLAAAGPGQQAATVTFTSHQAAASSPARTGCLRWRITLYLARPGRAYVIGNPPAGYYATDRAC
jgi:hypothetical protein